MVQSGSEWFRVGQSGSEWVGVGRSGSQWVGANFDDAQLIIVSNFSLEPLKINTGKHLYLFYLCFITYIIH